MACADDSGLAVRKKKTVALLTGGYTDDANVGTSQSYANRKDPRKIGNVL